MSEARLLVVVGARPNFVKVAPVVHALEGPSQVAVELVHTGQHYDRLLADSFLEQLSMPRPDHFLGVGSGSHARQSAAVLTGIEDLLGATPYDAVLVAGDVNSTMAAALAAAKCGVPVAHLESGLRSGDWTMPEEINRAVTDRISDLLLCHSEEALENLAAEGVPADRTALVGNTMIDSLFRLLDPGRATATLDSLELAPREFGLITLHRPALVDDPERLEAVIVALSRLSADLPLLFPVHPRTASKLAGLGDRIAPGLRITDPLEYLQFVDLEANARLVITDSGGVQEETSALGVPCFTYRANTERPVTQHLGTNTLVGVDPDALLEACQRELAGGPRTRPEPIPLWDGAAGERAAAAVTELVRGERPTLRDGGSAERLRPLQAS